MPPRGTEGRTNTEFAGSLFYRVGHYAGETDGSQAEGDEGEDTKEHGNEAFMRPDEHGKILIQRVGHANCLVLIESADIGADGVEKRGGIAGGANEKVVARGSEDRRW